MLDSLLSLATLPPWAYGLLFLLVLLDVFFPPAPGEIALVTSGALASDGGLSLALVVLAAASAAVAGDNGMYAIGRTLRRIDLRRHAPRLARRLPEVEARLGGRLVTALIAGRFLPFGRSATTLASGIIRLPWPRFAVIDLIAGTLWATQGASLGYVGGKTFQNALLAVPFGLVVALAITAALELARRRTATRSLAEESLRHPR